MGVPVMNNKEFEIFTKRLLELTPRDGAVLGLLAYTGMRLGEVEGLNWQDIAPGGVIGSAVYIRTSHGKVNYPRYVETPGALKTLLRRYVKWFDKEGLPRSPLKPVFLSAIKKKRFGVRDIQRCALRYTAEVLGVKYCPRSIRHTYATRIMKVCSIRVVQDLLGHRSLNSTMIYTHPTSQDRLDAVNAAFKKGGGKNAN